jgi:hypothetical protein
MSRRFCALMFAAVLATGLAACDNEEDDANESPQEQAEARGSSSDDAAEGDSTDGIR